jgi:hypothetical protein
MLKATLLSVASLAVGAGIGWQLHGDDEPAAPRAFASTPTSQPSMTRPAFASAASTFDIEQVRAVLREELAALAKHGPGQPAPAVVQQPATPELVAKRRVAAEEIETMIRGGNWGNEQRMAFHQRIGMLDAEQGARLLREVTIALNNGTLQVSTNGPPL